MGSLSPGGITAVSTLNPGVYPPSAVPYGRTYGEWGDEWWKWVLGIPAADNPLLDDTGAKAGVDQSGPVWFLVGSGGTSTERTCTVPAGKALFFPMLNWIGWIGTDADTVEGLRAIGKEFANHVTELEAVVDGTALQGLFNFRFHSPSSFYFTSVDFLGTIGYPAGLDGVPHESYAEGFWVMLEPLPPGDHVIRFGGKTVYPATYPSTQVFEVTATYHLTVQ